jgi:DNA-binding phage protein
MSRREAPWHSPEILKKPLRHGHSVTPLFAKELLREGVASLLGGDVDTAKTVLRDSINATIGFAELAHSTHLSPKSLMRMLSPTGNPYASNLFAILAYLQEEEGVRFEVRAKSAKAGASG